jgi:hypothetical protein
MPIEFTLLKDAPVPLSQCPKCGASPFSPFMRGQVQRSKWSWDWLVSVFTRRPFAYCALICRHCKEVVGYESPDTRIIESLAPAFDALEEFRELPCAKCGSTGDTMPCLVCDKPICPAHTKGAGFCGCYVMPSLENHGER